MLFSQQVALSNALRTVDGGPRRKVQTDADASENTGRPLIYITQAAMGRATDIWGGSSAPEYDCAHYVQLRYLV